MTRVAGSPRISVVVPVRNGARDIHRQLGALSEQDVGEPFEVVVADNGSTDDTVAVVKSWGDRLPSLRVIDAQGPATVAHGRNVGAQQARGELVLFCDADDRVHPEWVREMAKSLDDYDAVGARSLLIDATQEPEQVTGELKLASVHGYLPYALGCNCGVTRSWLFKLGGFDLSYEGGHEESDFFWRLQKAGGSLGYAPNALLDYRQRTSAMGLFRQRRRYAASSILLWVRFHEYADLDPISFKGAVRHCLVAILKSYRVLRRATRQDQLATYGWVVGLLEGHLRYRVCKSPPPCLGIETR
ncbi:glycosyltransferase [Kocuria sp. M1R5S2]|uniref:glycosyltransferase n=1 Tax=Kocuria rhizosphaerae TaxID=3376285 RepID=UPI0037A72242